MDMPSVYVLSNRRKALLMHRRTYYLDDDIRMVCKWQVAGTEIIMGKGKTPVVQD